MQYTFVPESLELYHTLYYGGYCRWEKAISGCIQRVKAFCASRRMEFHPWPWSKSILALCIPEQGGWRFRCTLSLICPCLPSCFVYKVAAMCHKPVLILCLKLPSLLVHSRWYRSENYKKWVLTVHVSAMSLHFSPICASDDANPLWLGFLHH